MSAPRMPLLLAVALLVALGGAASSLMGEKARTPRSILHPSEAAKVATVASAPAAAPLLASPSQAAAAETSQGLGLLAFKDPKTGSLRAGEAADVRALARKKARATPDRRLRSAHARLRAASAEAGQPGQAYLQGPDGAVGVLLDEGHMSTLVATVGSDGRVSLAHEDDLAAAEARVKGSRKAAQTQEER